VTLPKSASTTAHGQSENAEIEIPALRKQVVFTICVVSDVSSSVSGEEARHTSSYQEDTYSRHFATVDAITASLVFAEAHGFSLSAAQLLHPGAIATRDLSSLTKPFRNCRRAKSGISLGSASRERTISDRPWACVSSIASSLEEHRCQSRVR